MNKKLNLTEEQVLKLYADEKTDTLVEEYIFGGKKIWATTRPFSINIQSAWEIVDKITKSLDEGLDKEGTLGFFTLDRLGYDCCKNGNPIDHGQYRCYFAYDSKEDENRKDYMATADTPELAIVRAALLTCI
mgnify:CR=1 FL=1